MRSAGGAADMLLDAGSDGDAHAGGGATAGRAERTHSVRARFLLLDFYTWGVRYGHHATVPVPEVSVTWGFTTAPCARGDLFHSEARGVPDPLPCPGHCV